MVHLRINGKLYRYSTQGKCKVIELPKNFSPQILNALTPNYSELGKIKCPRSSILTLARSDFIPDEITIGIIEDQ